MFERFMFKKVELWVVLLIVISGTIAALLFGWATLSAATGENLSGRLGHYAHGLSHCVG
jgi:hypothetical protein